MVGRLRTGDRLSVNGAALPLNGEREGVEDDVFVVVVVDAGEDSSCCWVDEGGCDEVSSGCKRAWSRALNSRLWVSMSKFACQNGESLHILERTWLSFSCRCFSRTPGAIHFLELP